MRRLVLAGAVTVALATAAQGAGAATAAPQGTGAATAAAGAATAAVYRPAATPGAGVPRAYTFLDQLMDLYATGSTTRLVQSFTGGALQGYTASQTYDDALVIDAYLAKRTSDALARAQVIGNALLYVQQHDPKADGRFRAAYAPNPLLEPADITIDDKTTDVGAMAWAGQALIQLYARTGSSQYLTGAEQIGSWIQAHCHDTRGAGGYTGGVTAGGSPIKWKSTEHNIDLYALYTLLATQTGNSSWSADASWARGFVTAMWDAPQRRFYAGTGTDGQTINNSFQPEDVNSWSYLALRDQAYATSLTWEESNLAVTVSGHPGVSICKGDRTGEWYEGTAHLADALYLRNSGTDGRQAAKYLAGLSTAQANGPNNDGLGIIAASKDKLSDCDGGYYYASLHTGATSWYIMAAGKINPFGPISG